MADVTERMLLNALWDRLTKPVNGFTPRYTMAEHVRHDPTYGTSIADAIAVDTWGSGHYRLEGYEVKCTRSDWRRELAVRGGMPYAKSLPWRQHCARWYIVAPRGVVPTHELPARWGLIEWHAGALRARVQADNDPDGALPLPPRQVAGLMRATMQTATFHTRRLLESTCR